jgi:hypothetical protein
MTVRPPGSGHCEGANYRNDGEGANHDASPGTMRPETVRLEWMNMQFEVREYLSIHPAELSSADTS